ncbi:10334_t:CDS:2 [Ambispora gerdemannii]|uniref:10334_t:CDS:1 n=1 Tax=Ambispora gerdemannii TaxID=144530 RepID=A0A9N9E6R8_9GLOM|nr:10334_t:CDS:2 [Ambispora gerdemannii]
MERSQDHIDGGNWWQRPARRCQGTVGDLLGHLSSKTVVSVGDLLGCLTFEAVLGDDHKIIYTAGIGGSDLLGRLSFKTALGRRKPARLPDVRDGVRER